MSFGAVEDGENLSFSTVITYVVLYSQHQKTLFAAFFSQTAEFLLLFLSRIKGDSFVDGTRLSRTLPDLDLVPKYV